MPAGRSSRRTPFDRRPRAGQPDPRRLAGRIAGCNLGKPVENGDFWTPDRIRAYLEMADAYPLRDYIPALDPMPEVPAPPELARDHPWPGSRLGS